MTPATIPNKKQQRYKIDTHDFSVIWAKQLAIENDLKDKSTSWRSFVLQIVNLMGDDNKSYEYPADLDMSKEDDQYTFGSERCYNKCKSIQSKLMKLKGKAPALPEGWRNRNGSGKDRRVIDWDEIGDLFG